MLAEQTRAWEEQRRSAEEEEEEEEEAAAEGKGGPTGQGQGQGQGGQPGHPKLGPRATSVGSVGMGASGRMSASGRMPTAAGHLIKRMSEGRLGGSFKADAVIKKHSLVCAPLRSGRGSDEEVEVSSPAGAGLAAARSSAGGGAPSSTSNPDPDC